MLENCKNKQERWDGVQSLVDRWLAERQELVVLLFSLSDANDFSAKCSQSISRLRQFSQILLDYVSAGHFEVYDQLVREAEEYNDGSECLLSKLFPQIKESTDIALAFNDTYDTDEHCDQALGRLKDELSLLAESMTQRFALEDRLIKRLHESHNPENQDMAAMA
ncbi:MAG: sigma D regulator [Pseudomonadales bacterium]|nr:sigma D regulator [Pseudomonadales bacterium]